jgi:rhamnosyltransferase
MSSFSVCAVVVTHRPDEAFRQRLQALDGQVAHCVVIYNGFTSVPGDAPQAENRCLLAHPLNNLAAAQNLGIRRARELGHTHVLLMDDDSTPSETMVSALLCLFEQGHATGLAAANLQEQDTPRRVKHLCSAKGILGCRRTILPGEVLTHLVTAIASGSLIPLSVMEACGLMDEGLVIDYIDKDFCLRLRQRGYTIAMHGDAVLKHRIGRASKHGPFTCLNHPPERRYTIWRNRSICLGRYMGQPVFFVTDLIGMVYDLFRVLAFEDFKKDKLKAMFCGLWDALRGNRASQSFPVKEF